MGFFVDIFEVLKAVKSWPVFQCELQKSHATDSVTDSKECSDVTVYVKNNSPSWRDIARAAYCCGEEAVLEQIFKCKIS